MSSKKTIANLVNAIVDEPQREAKRTEEEDSKPLSKEQVEKYGITPELEDRLNAVRTERTGRPRKGESRDKNPYEGRATFVVDLRLIRKLKYISLMDGKLLKDIQEEALSSYIEKWEAKNGKIKLN